MANIREQFDRFVQAFNAHDLDAIDRLTNPQCVLEAPSNQKASGLGELRDWNQSWMTGFPNCKISVRNVLVTGETSVAECIFEGTHTGTLKTAMGDIPATGKQLRGPFVQITTYDSAGLAVSTHLYYDIADIMTQLGLMPAPASAQA